MPLAIDSAGIGSEVDSIDGQGDANVRIASGDHGFKGGFQLDRSIVGDGAGVVSTSQQHVAVEFTGGGIGSELFEEFRAYKGEGDLFRGTAIGIDGEQHVGAVGWCRAGCLG
jgi:hypothetical protein